MLVNLDGKTQMVDIDESSSRNGFSQGALWRMLLTVFLVMNGLMVVFLYLFDLL